MSADLVGRMVLGRYRIVRQLAEGGMGVVYLARAEGAAGFMKPVVIKLILAKHAQNPRFLAMFVREAQILAQLRHPGIVDVLEFAEESGAYVMVLEYIAGFHLGQWHSYLELKQRRVPVELAIQIVISVVDALHHVHTQCLPDGTPLNITHRDISPSNILLGNDGYARLLDFGVARMEVETLFRTEGGGFRGKIAYAAPEMFDSGESTQQSDLYSSAAVLHELLLGRNVFVGQNQAETMAKVLNLVPGPVRSGRDDVPEAIDAILARALAKAPADRYATAAEFAQALRATQRTPEQALREQLAALLRADFGSDMAELLGIESLAMRERAWRSFSMLPPQAPADSSIHEQQTRATETPIAVDSAAAKPASEGGTAGAPSAKRKPRAMAVTALGAAALAVLAATAWRFAEARPKAPERIVLVQKDYREPQAAAATTAAMAVGTVAPPAPSVPPPASAPAAVSSARPAPRVSARPPAPSSVGSDAAALTRAFRQKQKQVQDCFTAHAADAPAASAVAIRFDVDAQGRTAQATLDPAALDATALGACLRNVALATRFPESGKALSFRIPVTARKL
jgi:serine/threonine protein kinase